VLAQADQKKVIDKALYVARQEAEELLRVADEQRKAILADGRRRAAQAREEAMVRGASTSFARAAEEALEAFRKRAERYAEAADDIRTLALEIVRKVLGAEPDIAGKDVEKILERGLAQLRARRRLRIQLPTGRAAELRFERSNLMKALTAQPDLVVEEADDVGVGFARVVTEIGGALCAEESALDAVALAVNVRETPRSRDERGGAVTAPLVARGGGRGAMTSPRATEDSVSVDDGVLSEGPTAPVRPDRERTARLAAERRAAPAATPTAALDVLPDADVRLEDLSSMARGGHTGSDDDEDDATRALPAPRPRSEARLGARALPAPAPRVGARAHSLPPSPARPIADAGQAHGERERERLARERVPTGQVQAGGRAAARVSDREDDDEELDLYTDGPPRRGPFSPPTPRRE
jgi:flagellar biosynthesis/type III secretory pathway protein FliH